MAVWKVRTEPDGAKDHYRDGFLGGPGCNMGNAHSVKNGWNYNGSRPEAFGGAQKWPNVTAHVSLPADRGDLAPKLTLQLRKFIDDFLTEHGL